MAEQPDIETMRIVAPDAGELERAAEAALRPKKLSEFVGQRVVRGQLQLVLDAARMRASTPDHVLLAGPPGLGKTTLAMIIAAEMGTSLRLRPRHPACGRPGRNPVGPAGRRHPLY